MSHHEHVRTRNCHHVNSHNIMSYHFTPLACLITPLQWSDYFAITSDQIDHIIVLSDCIVVMSDHTTICISHHTYISVSDHISVMADYIVVVSDHMTIFISHHTYISESDHITVMADHTAITSDHSSDRLVGQVVRRPPQEWVRSSLNSRGFFLIESY